MVEFGNKPKNIVLAPAPERKPEPKPKDTTFGGEPTTAPELPETPVIDEVQVTAPVEKELQEISSDDVGSIEDLGLTPERPSSPAEEVKKADVAKTTPKPKSKQHKKGKNKHTKKKRRHGR